MAELVFTLPPVVLASSEAASEATTSVTPEATPETASSRVTSIASSEASARVSTVAAPEAPSISSEAASVEASPREPSLRTVVLNEVVVGPPPRLRFDAHLPLLIRGLEHAVLPIKLLRPLRLLPDLLMLSSIVRRVPLVPLSDRPLSPRQLLALLLLEPLPLHLEPLVVLPCALSR